MTGPTHGLLFERLNESNYISWVEKMKCYLIREGLWKAAQKAPDMDDDDEVEADEKARAAIVLAVENSQLVFLRDKTTALGCWTALKELYQRTTAGSKLILPPVNNSISKDRGDKLAEANAVREMLHLWSNQPPSRNCQPGRQPTPDVSNRLCRGPKGSAFLVQRTQAPKSTWLLDTGSTEHIVARASSL
uniref:Uncharacterized protein n=1 Tax=Sphaerodactylus townsendi TaxID=933632 RepID=A0ACB8F473_9SAUR